MKKQTKKKHDVDCFPSLKEGDKLIFVPEMAGGDSGEAGGTPKGERELVVEKLLGEGEYTKVWRVSEKSAKNDYKPFAIKILNRKGNAEDEADFRNEINNTETMFRIVSGEPKENNADEPEFPFVVKILASGKVIASEEGNDNNGENGNLCFLMEPADCSLKERILHFNSKGIFITLNDSSVEGKKKSFSRMMWAFYCMRHLVAICEKIRESMTITVKSHCNIKLENILYFIIKPKDTLQAGIKPEDTLQTGIKPEDMRCPADKPGAVRTPMLTDFRLAEFSEKGEQKSGDIEKSKNRRMKIRRMEILKKSVYAAPELKKKEGATVHLWSDVYSLGIIFYELIKGDIFASPGKGNNVAKENIEEYFGELDKYFFIKSSPENPINFKSFITNVLNDTPKQRYEVKRKQMSLGKGKQKENDQIYSTLRHKFMALEEKFMQSAKEFFKNKLLKEAREYLNKKPLNTEDIECAINKIDLIFPESVRYSCLEKEKEGSDEIAKAEKDYARKTCRLLKSGGSDNAMDKMKKILPKPNVPYGKVKRMSKDDVEEVFIQLEKVLDECHGFMSHCYSHRYYRERLWRLLTSCGEPKAHEQPHESDVFENMILSIFKTQ